MPLTISAIKSSYSGDQSGGCRNSKSSSVQLGSVGQSTETKEAGVIVDEYGCLQINMSRAEQ